MFCRFSGGGFSSQILVGGGWDISAHVTTDRWSPDICTSASTVSAVSWKNPRAHVILGGVDVEKFSPDDSIAREPMVLFVGRILRHMGINYLIPWILRWRSLAKLPTSVIWTNCSSRLTVGVIFRRDCDDEALVNAYGGHCASCCPAFYRTMYSNEAGCRSRAVRDRWMGWYAALRLSARMSPACRRSRGWRQRGFIVPSNPRWVKGFDRSSIGSKQSKWAQLDGGAYLRNSPGHKW
jgi:hypothetical protein